MLGDMEFCWWDHCDLCSHWLGGCREFVDVDDNSPAPHGVACPDCLVPPKLFPHKGEPVPLQRKRACAG